MTKRSEKEKIDFSKVLYTIGALKFGSFTLTSGRMSPYYLDLRIVSSFPDAFKKICDWYVNFVKSEINITNFDRIAGIPYGGVPFATLIAYHLQKPFLYVRKGIRLHGRQRRIEGVLAPGDVVLIIDDLITTGLSIDKATNSILAEGGKVTDAVVLIDREEGGREKLEKNGIKIHALMNIREIAAKLSEIGAISEDQYKIILKQTKS